MFLHTEPYRSLIQSVLLLLLMSSSLWRQHSVMVVFAVFAVEQHCLFKRVRNKNDCSSSVAINHNSEGPFNVHHVDGCTHIKGKLFQSFINFILSQCGEQMQKASNLPVSWTQSSSPIYGATAAKSAHAAHIVSIERWFTNTVKRLTSQHRPEHDSVVFQKISQLFPPTCDLT